MRFCVLPGFWPRWALSRPESGIAVPATLVFGLGCFMRGCSLSLFLSLSLSLSFFLSFFLSFSPLSLYLALSLQQCMNLVRDFYHTCGWIYVRTTWTFRTIVYIYIYSRFICNINICVYYTDLFTIYIYIYVCMYIYIYRYVCMYIYIYMYVYIYIYVCIYIYIYICICNIYI